MSGFKLRNMEEKDIDTVYEHIHQSYVNKYFKNERIQRELHNKEYSSIIHSKNYIFHIFENDSDNFIAMVRYKIEDKLKNDTTEVAIYLNKDFREKHFSKEILETSLKKLKENKKEIKNIEAYILEENIASKKLFLNLGFKLIETKNSNELDYLVFRLVL